MYPKLFEIGPVPVYSYGLMLGITFLVASSLFNRELKRNGMDENISVTITFLCLIGGIVGSKLFYVIEEWNFGGGLPLSSYLTKDVLLSPSGLTFYGGLIFAIVLVLIYCRSKKLSVLKIFDLMAPGAAIGYGFARIGCHLSGDGDYGIPVNGTMWEFLGYSYLNGTVPTKPGVLVHPTSIYEFIAAIFIFLFLWKSRDKYKTSGIIFAYYLILSGIERLIIEVIRLNPRIVMGLSQAQIISLVMILIGVFLLYIKLSDEKKLITKSVQTH
ncbi:MAG: prolipoprotein diacylglyceryl transferase [Ignavibacteria bacterium]|jgi:phosphatidylglycerol:prolipoprotein diacylglycerol transferase|nr:prolipoprotein diacylglyceryl transferase [Ignavibacteria bacterium]